MSALKALAHWRSGPLDEAGYRAGVGIVVARPSGGILWARRRGESRWQMPQGGIEPGETPEQAMYRELFEEVGLRAAHVVLLGCVERWLCYELPQGLRRGLRFGAGRYVGQRQKWYLLGLRAPDETVRLDVAKPAEFDRWRWVGYWHPLSGGVDFKREVYRAALSDLAGAYHALVQNAADEAR